MYVVCIQHRLNMYVYVHTQTQILTHLYTLIHRQKIYYIIYNMQTKKSSFYYKLQTLNNLFQYKDLEHFYLFTTKIKNR